MNKKKMTLGIVIPNRNDSIYLAKCISSITNQTNFPDEVIILDDNSSDNSLEVIEKYIQGYNFFKLIKNKKQLGAIENSNKGLLLSSTDYVFFLGANDFIYPNFVEEYKKIINSSSIEYGVLSGLVNLVDTNDKLIKTHNSPIISTDQIYINSDLCINYFNKFGSWLTGQSLVYKRSYLMECGFDTRLGGLNDLFSAVNIACKFGAVFIPKILGVMRIHPNAFLQNTLLDESKMKEIFNIIAHDGPLLNKKLFTDKTITKLFNRLRFSAFASALKSNKSYDYLFSSKIILLIIKLLPLTQLKFIFGLIYFRWFDIFLSIYYREIKKLFIKI